MKKTIYSILLISTSSLLAPGCGSDETGSNSSTKLEKAEGSREDMNDLIGFYNKALQYSERYTKYENDLAAYIEKAYKNIEYKQKNTPGIPPTMIAPMYVSVHGLNNIKYPKILGGPDGEYAQILKDWDANYTLMRDKVTEIKNYISAEDFKDDNNARLVKIEEEVKNLSLKNQELSEKLFSGLKPKVDAAENEILKNHPLKEHITNSKAVLELANTITGNIFNAQNEADVQSAIAKNYDALEGLAQKNTSLSIPADKVSSGQEAAYKRFNDAIQEYLGALRATRRKVSEGEALKENDLDKIERAAENILSTYNNFVD